ncbi:aryl-sulfate sulfotransferase [Flavihumibacter solisilvae]|uniref:aryl-sulfate sulfotransferase n=1 Tax=Flavihumibacter solisilvae TaxID=1349421 RepID=UPI0006893040|nr:aryl-sulfate sulfotransferase [Flavihumibacter solisilvae]
MEIIKFFLSQVLQARLAVPVLFMGLFLSGCTSGCINQVISISEVGPAGNILVRKLKIVTRDSVDLFVRYWEKQNKDRVLTTQVSKNSRQHVQTMLYLKPGTAYEYQVVVEKRGCQSMGQVESFINQELPAGLSEILMPAERKQSLPVKYQQGFTLVARRELPGQMYIADVKGNIIWYHTVRDAGFKVAHFTARSTLLSILAPLSYPTSYGDEILEVSLAGDTLFHLKKGDKGLDKTIHHEIFYNAANQLVTLTLEKKVVDLSSVGGSKADTVTGDGILVLDRHGNKVWSWSVFDVIDPKSDPRILKDKSDWLHANSLSIDRDGNYLMSFYLSGQVWKINASNGELIWKLGRGGDFSFSKHGEFSGPGSATFSESHAVHRSADNKLLLFENGTNKKRSRVLAYSLDEDRHEASLAENIELPLHLYSERMGSAYWVDSSSLLVCSSQANSVALTDRSGEILWRIRTGFVPYRAEFIDSLPMFRN